MKRKIFIDTSAFIALVCEKDDFHEEVNKVFAKLGSEAVDFVVTDYVLDEVVTLLRCREKMSTKKVVLFLKSCYASDVQIVGITQEIFIASLRLMSRYGDQYFSFTDCVSFVVMKSMKIKEAIASDKHFVIAGFRNLLTTC